MIESLETFARKCACANSNFDILMETVKDYHPVVPPEIKNHCSCSSHHSAHCEYQLPNIRKVVFNEESGVTVVLWEDGERTVVRLGKGETFDRYNGFMAAICKRLFGGTSTAKKLMNSKDEALVKQKAEKEKEETRKKAEEQAELLREKARKNRERRHKDLVQFYVEEYKAKKEAEEVIHVEENAKSAKEEFLANLSSQIAKEIAENLEQMDENRGD